MFSCSLEVLRPLEVLLVSFPCIRRLFILILSGLAIGRRTTATDLPQTVAALHSVVGLAAVMTSIGSVMAHLAGISTLHLVSGYLGVLIGKSLLFLVFE
jgi:NAD/NADP transhydrogenase beta subunit